MLLDAASKIISMVISGRLQRLLKEVGIEEQNGFMGGRGGSDGIFCIRQAMKKRREHGKELWILFVDLVKAFDTLPWGVLFVVLAKLGVPPHLTSVIKRMNTALQVTFDLNGARGGALHRWRQAGVPAQPDSFPLRDAGRA